MQRWIMHIDMDAFYASVEQRDNPLLKGLPVIVGGLSKRGVVSTASYEARKFGVKSAMPMETARKLCPDGVFILPDIKKYKNISDEIMSILAGFSPIVQPMSIDEAFLDLSGITTDLEDYAFRLKKEVVEKTALTASVGIAPNKFLAKFASDYKKPDGFMLIRKEDAASILAPLPVGMIFGIGKVTQDKLKSYGVNMISDLLSADRHVLEKVLGKQTESVLLLAQGIDHRAVETDVEMKSIGKEDTYEKDIFSLNDIQAEFLLLAQKVGWRLRSKGLCGFSLAIKVRFSSFETITRSISSEFPYYYDEDIYDAALKLAKKCSFAKGVRLLGITVAKLQKYDMAEPVFDFDGSEAKKQKRTAAIDKLKSRFGEQIINKGLLPEK